MASRPILSIFPPYLAPHNVERLLPPVGKFRQGFYPLGIELLGLLRKPAILLHLVHLQQTSLTLYRETFEASFCRYG
jgi:hypothetical protein